MQASVLIKVSQHHLKKKTHTYLVSSVNIQYLRKFSYNKLHTARTRVEFISVAKLQTDGDSDMSDMSRCMLGRQSAAELEINKNTKARKDFKKSLRSHKTKNVDKVLQNLKSTRIPRRKRTISYADV